MTSFVSYPYSIGLPHFLCRIVVLNPQELRRGRIIFSAEGDGFFSSSTTLPCLHPSRTIILCLSFTPVTLTLTLTLLSRAKLSQSCLPWFCDRFLRASSPPTDNTCAAQTDSQKFDQTPQFELLIFSITALHCTWALLLLDTSAFTWSLGLFEPRLRHGES